VRSSYQIKFKRQINQSTGPMYCLLFVAFYCLLHRPSVLSSRIKASKLSLFKSRDNMFKSRFCWRKNSAFNIPSNEAPLNYTSEHALRPAIRHHACSTLVMASKRLIRLLQHRLGMNASTVPSYKEPPPYSPATAQAVFIDIYFPNHALSQDVPRKSKHEEHEVDMEAMIAAIPLMPDIFNLYKVKGNLFSPRPTIRYSKKLPHTAIVDTTLKRPRKQPTRKRFRNSKTRSKDGRERNEIADRPSRN
jgi:hypothetical protein